MGEIELDYRKAHWQIEFDSRLPYSNTKFDYLKVVLPEVKFIPVSEWIIEETDKREIFILPEWSSKFNDLVV